MDHPPFRIGDDRERGGPVEIADIVLKVLYNFLRRLHIYF